ncbi:MAG TPA: hypothetical protein VHU16_07080 [Candidatus Udaeobacter sp.]|nr:hypothetical protein [Candidatus Udaeobacter sp.]
MTTLLNPSHNGGLIRKPLLRRILAVALIGASLAIFLCAAGVVSYGHPAGSTPLSVTANAQFYPTFGTPNDALVTDDNAHVLVSVIGATTPCPGKPTPPPTTFTTGVQVFSTSDFTNNPCGGQQIINFPSSPRPPVEKIDGMQFFPGSPQVSVGAAIERQGAEFFRLASLNEPCGMDGVIQVPQYPIKNCSNCPNCAPGTFDVAVTPDGHYAFVANEYGLMPSPTPTPETGGGTIGVIRMERDAAGRFTRGRLVQPYNTIYIPGGDTIPGITMSHDGRYLYVTCEGSAEGINPETGKKYRDPTNVAPTRNGVVLCPGCRAGIGSCDNESNGPPFTQNGLLAIIDVDMATKGMGQASIITTIATGCSPVRAVETENGQYVFVAARGRNTQLRLPPDPDARGSQVLAFNRSALVSASPNNALVGYGDTHGTAPVGLGLFNNDTLLAVANSNRFNNTGSECQNPPPGVPPCTANVSIMDVSNPAEPAVKQTIPAYANDAFPRNVTVGPDDTLYVPNANAQQLEVITTTVK